MLSTTFLFALDNTIVADIQPAIINDLGQMQLLPWVGTGFALGTMVVLPLSKAYGVFSIRSLYLANILLFQVGSAICGAAPNMNAMVLGRVIAGVGGAGMYAGTLTYVSVCTTMGERASYMAGSTVMWGVGTVLGPVIGGAFAESSATWRWGFYINLVVGAFFCPAYLFLFPSIDPKPNMPVSQKLKSIDWPLTFTFLSGSAYLIMAISFGGILYSWRSGVEITFLTLSGTVTYYIPLYFQFVRGDGPLDAGIRLLPLVISMIASTIVSGLITVPDTANENTGNSKIYGYTIMIGFGAGCYVVVGFTILQSLIPPREVSNAIAVMTIAQNLGMVLFLSLCGNIFQNMAVQEVGNALQHLSEDQVLELIAGTSSRAFQSLSAYERSLVVVSITSALRHVWTLFLVAGAVSFVFSLPLVLIHSDCTKFESTSSGPASKIRAEVQLGTRKNEFSGFSMPNANHKLPELMPLPNRSHSTDWLSFESNPVLEEQVTMSTARNPNDTNPYLALDQLLQLDSNTETHEESFWDPLLQPFSHIGPQFLMEDQSPFPETTQLPTISPINTAMGSVRDKPKTQDYSTATDQRLDQELPKLCHCFFQYVYASMPILCESRFYTELIDRPNAGSVTALQYAVALVTAAVSKPYNHLVKELYALVRWYIEDCERSLEPSAFFNLNIFQSLLFLVRIDSIEGPGEIVPGLHVSLPVTEDPILLEERRRSFWLLFVWEAYVKTRSGMNSQLGPVSSFHVKLPSPGRLGPDFMPVDMSFLSDAETSAYTESPFAACVLMVDLAIKCLEFQPSASTELTKLHSSLLKCFHERMLTAEIVFNQGNASPDPVALTTYVNMGAIELILNNMLLKGPWKISLQHEEVIEKTQHLQTTAQGIVDNLRLAWNDRMIQGNCFTLQGTFLAWPLATAINNLAEEVQPCFSKERINVLEKGFVILDELEPEESYWHKFTQGAREKLQYGTRRSY
ncbi:major facilitator superfamily transporter [Fusarium longipes]|uniref:Major facilitator superfamily transporter n=1 Tax=Fusarium longipes TaxID=694270 RepID=A0A395SZY6_9HYPO|nr:major facilitator superfamily transporter [Fusarium longipes]